MTGGICVSTHLSVIPYFNLYSLIYNYLH